MENCLKKCGSQGTRASFSDIAATILSYLGVTGDIAGDAIEIF